MDNSKQSKPARYYIALFLGGIIWGAIPILLTQTLAKMETRWMVLFFIIWFAVLWATIVFSIIYWRKKEKHDPGQTLPWYRSKVFRTVLIIYAIFVSISSFFHLIGYMTAYKEILKIYDQPVEPNYNSIPGLSSDCVTAIKYKGLPEDMINSCDYATSTYWGKDDANPFTDPYYGKDIKNINIEYGPPISCSSSGCEYHDISVTIWPDGKITDGK